MGRLEPNKRGMPTTSAVLAWFLLAGLALVATACGTTAVHPESIVAKAPTTSSKVGQRDFTAEGFPPKVGSYIASDHAGNPVGYVLTSQLMPTDPKEAQALNARTMLSVTDADGATVGYWALAIGFVPLDVATQPGFDIEDYRAKMYGGCEPAIGGGVGEKYPLCPALGDSKGP